MDKPLQPTSEYSVSSGCRESVAVFRSGFTLIELSIVLVIIGLIIGGILVGQDLINAATIRAQVTQIEKFNTAVNTFRNKYGDQLPGDMTNPGQFGLMQSYAQVNNSSPTADGDGNGYIEDCIAYNSGAYTQEFGCETMLFWVHLSQSSLIAEQFNNQKAPDSGTIPNINSCCGTPLNNFLPIAKINGGSGGSAGNYIIAFTGAPQPATTYQYIPVGYNYFGLVYIANVGAGTYNPGNGLPTAITPIQAYAIDKKTDDGLPYTGSVLSISSHTGGTSGFIVNSQGFVTNCATAVTPSGSGYWGGNTSNTYNVGSTTYQNQLECNLAFRFQ